MSDPTPAAAGQTTPAPPPPQARGQKIGRWAVIVGAICIAIAAAVRLFGSFTLPSCEASRTTDALRDIFRDHKVEVTRIADFTTVSSSLSEIACTARVDRPGSYEMISYRVFRSGLTPRVEITASLPSCESSQTTDALRNIFRERKIAIDDISELQTLTASASENTCTAQVTAPGEVATISFRVFLQEKAPRVLITNVQSKPK